MTIRLPHSYLTLWVKMYSKCTIYLHYPSFHPFLLLNHQHSRSLLWELQSPTQIKGHMIFMTTYGSHLALEMVFPCCFPHCHSLQPGVVASCVPHLPSSDLLLTDGAQFQLRMHHQVHSLMYGIDHWSTKNINNYLFKFAIVLLQHLCWYFNPEKTGIFIHMPL